RGLPENVMADHSRRIPGEVAIAPAIDDLLQALPDDRRLGPAHDVFGVHAGGIGQLVPGAGLDFLHRGAGVVVLQLSARQELAIFGIHAVGLLKLSMEVAAARAGGSVPSHAAVAADWLNVPVVAVPPGTGGPG